MSEELKRFEPTPLTLPPEVVEMLLAFVLAKKSGQVILHMHQGRITFVESNEKRVVPSPAA